MTTAGVAVSRIETADDYFRVIARLNRRWRVIECRNGIQWILQRRGSPEKVRRDDWRGRSYCRTREALIRCTREYCGAIDTRAAEGGASCRLRPIQKCEAHACWGAWAQGGIAKQVQLHLADCPATTKRLRTQLKNRLRMEILYDLQSDLTE
jgi:hypothetical protein